MLHGKVPPRLITFFALKRFAVYHIDAAMIGCSCESCYFLQLIKILFLSFAVESYQSAGQPRRLLWEQGELKIHLKSGFLFKLAEAVPMESGVVGRSGAMHHHQFPNGRIVNQKASMAMENMFILE